MITTIEAPPHVADLLRAIDPRWRAEIARQRKADQQPDYEDCRPWDINVHNDFGECFSVVNATRHIDPVEWSLIVPYFADGHLLCMRKLRVPMHVGCGYVFAPSKQHWTRGGNGLLVFAAFDFEQPPDADQIAEKWDVVATRLMEAARCEPPPRS